ncbi:MAG: hypothetical protein ACRC67_16180 [Inquilinus sp.]|uniref:hypothetical protein n=1 Tax=Inquilinus sp. TaxID=1932117 RepID=UPI003F387689
MTRWHGTVRRAGEFQPGAVRRCRARLNEGEHELARAAFFHQRGKILIFLRCLRDRNLWGVEQSEQITIRHSEFAADRFAREAAPVNQLAGARHRASAAK